MVIPLNNTHKKCHILKGIVFFGVMKKFANRTEDSGMISENYIIFGVITLFQELW